MLSTDPGKTKNVVFGYRPQAKDNDKLIDKTFLGDMMKSLGYASSLFEKRPDELFPKSLAELKVILNLFFRESKLKLNNHKVQNPKLNNSQAKTKRILSNNQLKLSRK